MDFDNLSMEEVGALIFGLFVVMILTLIVVSIVKAKQDADDSACPVLKEKVKVLEKEPVLVDTIVVSTKIMVETESGERLHLRAKAQNSIVVGDEGFLTWQGSKVINFERIILPKNETA